MKAMKAATITQSVTCSDNSSSRNKKKKRNQRPEAIQWGYSEHVAKLRTSSEDYSAVLFAAIQNLLRQPAE
jgi:hypothetical protein